MTERKEFVVFSRRVARELQSKGFECKDIRPSVKNEGKDVYIFENSSELKLAISQITGKLV